MFVTDFDQLIGNAKGQLYILSASCEMIQDMFPCLPLLSFLSKIQCYMFRGIFETIVAYAEIKLNTSCGNRQSEGQPLVRQTVRCYMPSM